MLDTTKLKNYGRLLLFTIAFTLSLKPIFYFTSQLTIWENPQEVQDVLKASTEFFFLFFFLLLTWKLVKLCVAPVTLRNYGEPITLNISHLEALWGLLVYQKVQNYQKSRERGINKVDSSLNAITESLEDDWRRLAGVPLLPSLVFGVYLLENKEEAYVKCSLSSLELLDAYKELNINHRNRNGVVSFYGDLDKWEVMAGILLALVEYERFNPDSKQTGYWIERLLGKRRFVVGGRALSADEVRDWGLDYLVKKEVTREQ